MAFFFFLHRWLLHLSIVWSGSFRREQSLSSYVNYRQTKRDILILFSGICFWQYEESSLKSLPKSEHLLLRHFDHRIMILNIVRRSHYWSWYIFTCFYSFNHFCSVDVRTLTRETSQQKFFGIARHFLQHFSTLIVFVWAKIILLAFMMFNSLVGRLRFCGLCAHIPIFIFIGVMNYKSGPCRFHRILGDPSAV